MNKTAVILLNLGGPDVQESVQPFLFNLFNDKAIIRLPKFLRYLIAKLISTRRAPVARAIYAQLGGGSPILKNTQAQADALERTLNTPFPVPHAASPAPIFKTFIAMRYWHPFADETIRAVKDFAPDTIILLPLYPQFSTTTTGSSFEQWHERAAAAGLKIPTKSICCYPQQAGFIGAVAAATRRAYDEAKKFGIPRILFSAHGLPEKIIKAGDPYAAQCAMTVEALRQALDIQNLDSILCFQSRVGPVKWIQPATDAEIVRAGRDKVPVVVVPIAFVCEHSETLVEIDIDFRHLAAAEDVPHFAYVPTAGIAPDFIACLAETVRAAIARDKICSSNTGQKLCPPSFAGCSCR